MIFTKGVTKLPWVGEKGVLSIKVIELQQNYNYKNVLKYVKKYER
jgi:hypothetical protein